MKTCTCLKTLPRSWRKAWCYGLSCRSEADRDRDSIAIPSRPGSCCQNNVPTRTTIVPSIRSHVTTGSQATENDVRFLELDSASWSMQQHSHLPLSPFVSARCCLLHLHGPFFFVLVLAHRYIRFFFLKQNYSSFYRKRLECRPEPKSSLGKPASQETEKKTRAQPLKRRKGLKQTTPPSLEHNTRTGVADGTPQRNSQV